MKVASFTVHASVEQSGRWNRAAEAEGHRSVGTWLAAAADAYLRVRAKAGLPVPLAWRRYGRLAVQLDSGKTFISGHVSPPFGAFRGNGATGAQRGGQHFSLVYLPEARIVATLRTFQQCRSLAAELASALIRGDPAGIVERYEREAK